MPSYSFKCEDCNTIFDITCKISEMRNQHCLHCNSTNYSSFHHAVQIGDSVRLGVKTIDGGFREVLSKIASNNYKSNLADKLSRR